MNRVLVIDDHEPNLMLYAKVVKNIPQCEPVSFTSPQGALRWADINEPALIVLDHQMPEMSGIEFIVALRKLRGRAETPIIMITGNSEREVRREALKSGASAFLGKPVDPIEFLAIAKNLVNAHVSRAESQSRADTAAAQARDLTTDLDARDREEIDALVRLMALRDRETAEHMLRTGIIAERIARRLGMPQFEVERLGLAARLHDIGKLGVPERLLQKTLKLTTDDLAAVRKHADDGFDLLRARKSSLLRLAADIAHSHHERYDGRGYPGGLRADAIPIESRIVALADAFSAMTAARPWRTAYSVGMALDEIEKESGHAFEPRIVGALREIINEVVPALAEVPALLGRR
jgi:putative two-component system response regulator